MNRRIYVVVFLFIFGALGVLRSVTNPRTALLHGSDIVALVGAAIGLLLAKRPFPGESLPG